VDIRDLLRQLKDHGFKLNLLLGLDFGQVSFPDNLQTGRTSSRGGGRQNSQVLEEQTQLLENPVAASSPSGNSVYVGYGRNYDPTKIYTDLELNDLAQSPSGEFNESVYNQLVASQTALKNAQQAASSQGTEEAEDGGEDAVPFGDMLTPFSAYDRQSFAAPGQNTVRGEGILAGRYDQRFGPGGTDPFAAANQAVGTAANYHLRHSRGQWEKVDWVVKQETTSRDWIGN
jgi:hypothetical protein